MTSVNRLAARWRKSSRSGGNGGACVEIGCSPEAHDFVGIRDTKNRDGGTLVVDRAAFGAFLAEVKKR